MFGRLFDVPIRLEKRKNVHMVWLLRAMPVGKLYEVYHKYHMREYVAGLGGWGEGADCDLPHQTRDQMMGDLCVLSHNKWSSE